MLLGFQSMKRLWSWYKKVSITYTFVLFLNSPNELGKSRKYKKVSITYTLYLLKCPSSVGVFMSSFGSLGSICGKNKKRSRQPPWKRPLPPFGSKVFKSFSKKVFRISVFPILADFWNPTFSPPLRGVTILYQDHEISFQKVRDHGCC